MSDTPVQEASTQHPAWIPHPCCEGEFFCTVHEQMAADCPYPAVEDWEGVDPYLGGGRPLTDLDPDGEHMPAEFAATILESRSGS